MQTNKHCYLKLRKKNHSFFKTSLWHGELPRKKRKKKTQLTTLDKTIRFESIQVSTNMYVSDGVGSNAKKMTIISLCSFVSWYNSIKTY